MMRGSTVHDHPISMARPMSDAQFIQELRSLLKAPYALLHIQTREEARALGLLHQLVTSLGMVLYDWSLTHGLNRQSHDGDLREAMEQVETFGQPAVFVFKDARWALDDPWIRRRLKELEYHCAESNKTIVFLGDQPLGWPDLEKEFTVLDLPLPDRALLEDAYDTLYGAQNDAAIRETLVSGAMGLTLKEASRAFQRVKQQQQEATQRNALFDVETSILREKQRIVGKNDALEFHTLDERMEDVGGLNNLKLWLADRSDAFSQEARHFGLPAPKGLLLVGVQGCGKSLTAKVIAHHWGLPLLRLDLGNVFDGKRSPEEALREALKTSEAIAPCVLWLDEIEKGFAQDQDGRAQRVLGSMLTWLQEKTQPVFLVATANNIGALPPELMRKGRFDEIFFLDLPDQTEREDILKIHLSRKHRSLQEDQLKALAERCDFFSGAELEQVVVSAMYSAFAKKRDITPDDLIFAARETVPLYRTYEEQIKSLREWASTRARPASQKRRVIDYFGAQ